MSESQLLPLLLSRTCLTHIDAYSELATSSSDHAHECFYDLEQKPNHNYCGPLLPNQLTHGSIWSMAQGRLMLPLEGLQAHGVDIYEACSGGRTPSVLKDLVGALPLYRQKRLIGNSLHIPAFMSWVCYVMSNVRWVDEFYQLPDMVPPSSSDDPDAEEADVGPTTEPKK